MSHPEQPHSPSSDAPRSPGQLERVGDAPPPEPTPTIGGCALGPYETNTYVIFVPDGERPDCWIVDPSFDPEPVIEGVRESGLQPVAVVLTHAHLDHIAGVKDVLTAFSTPARRVPVWIHTAEREWLNDPMLNLSAMAGMPVTAPGPDRLLNDADVLELAGTRWRVLHTPGHSPGGITLYHAGSGQAIVGDTLFAGSVGRTDFPGADPATLANSIRTKLYALPDATRVYPGHGPETSIGRERRSNPFVRG